MVFLFHIIWGCRSFGQILCAAKGIGNAQRCLEECYLSRVSWGQTDSKGSSTCSQGSCLGSRFLFVAGLLWGMREALYVRAKSPSIFPSLMCCKIPVVRITISTPSLLMLVQGWIPGHYCTHELPVSWEKSRGWELQPHVGDFNYLIKSYVQGISPYPFWGLCLLLVSPTRDWLSLPLPDLAKKCVVKLYCSTLSQDCWMQVETFGEVFKGATGTEVLNFLFTNASVRHLLCCWVWIDLNSSNDV